MLKSKATEISNTLFPNQRLQLLKRCIFCTEKFFTPKGEQWGDERIGCHLIKCAYTKNLEYDYVKYITNMKLREIIKSKTLLDLVIDYDQLKKRKRTNRYMKRKRSILSSNSSTISIVNSRLERVLKYNFNIDNRHSRVNKSNHRSPFIESQLAIKYMKPNEECTIISKYQ